MLFISINSLEEQTGGGMYARTLYHGLSILEKVSVIDKATQRTPSKRNAGSLGLYKGAIQDLVARLLLCPAFTGFYLFTILCKIRDHHIIVFHNSRQGGILALARFLYPAKKLVMCFDNVEQQLLKSYRSTGLLKRCMDMVDGILAPVVEKLGYRCANVCTFITEADRSYFVNIYGEKPCPSVVIPVSLPDCAAPVSAPLPCREPLRVLFTASFLFPPNQTAMREVVEVARIAGSEFEFHLAGRGLDQVLDDELRRAKNIRFFSDPDVETMAQIFESADIYFAPVREGSGMKTKVAEALSHGLPVVATPHALSGYERVLDIESVAVYQDVNDAALRLREMGSVIRCGAGSLRKSAHSAFMLHYAQSSVDQKFLDLMSVLDASK